MRLKNIYRIVLVIVSVWLICGCSGFGKLRLPSPSDDKLTLDDLVNNSSDYDIYYWGYDLDNASGIVFDPKGDANILEVGFGWEKIEGREAVATVVKWVDIRDVDYTPTLYRILGPDDAFFGYLFTGWFHVVLKAKAPGVLYLYSIDAPPQYLHEGDEVRK